ncbi:serine/threonine-protein kinase [Grosmannia clavigera kw1407]|uniref:non-specific serine/threonine protein kinase n=1 Tax=Grosmannia clavigera (strain kw1407 / UAMH 11150) TaxID=655863 RepID=F0XGG6_GROCL|nr:serine/threonine-protein kinase [Grosmannia clavigera kw1407]EFX02623.1 serine/threonine-protein kinase [Grosmannia clavigera kw1407]
MASFVASLFDRTAAVAGAASGGQPSTPPKNSFVAPAMTPQGSPSKKMMPPGAHELPEAHEGRLKMGGSSNGYGINSGQSNGSNGSNGSNSSNSSNGKAISNIVVPVPSLFDNAVRLGRPQLGGGTSGKALTPTKGSSNMLPPGCGGGGGSSTGLDDPFATDDSSGLHKTTGAMSGAVGHLAMGSSQKGGGGRGANKENKDEAGGMATHGDGATAKAKAKENMVPVPHHSLGPPARLPLPSEVAAAAAAAAAAGGHHHNHAALSRHEMYQTKERPMMATVKRFNTSRGLTADELEILKRPNIRRMVNVTQLYFLDYYFDLLTYVGSRQNRLNAFRAEFPAPPETDEETYRHMWQKYAGRERANLRKRRMRLRHGDFQILTQVGQGGYGQVFLAQKKDTREVCALKVMSKKLLFKLDEVRHVLTERDILTTAKSEWLVRLLYSFQDDKSIYLAMEYVPGGDFRTLLNNTGVLSNRHARFYIAEMFCAVDALHQLGYIHRDLKPENFLVDSTGHVKLTDFGLAAGMLSPAKIESMRVRLEQASETAVPFGKPMEQRTVAERREGYRTMRDRDTAYAKSIVGSPDYMAPEVLRGEEYDFTVDYWSLGCMLFEALTGFPPFAGATPDETWRNLKHWREVLKRPVWEDPNYFLSNRTWSFITTCINGRAKRFSRIDDILHHQYFAEVDWATLRASKAPFVPELDSETDAGYFDDFSNEADMAKYKEVHDKQAALEDMAEREDAMQKGLFVGFTFRHRKTAGGAADDLNAGLASVSNGRASPRKPLTADTFGGPAVSASASASAPATPQTASPPFGTML